MIKRLSWSVALLMGTAAAGISLGPVAAQQMRENVPPVLTKPAPAPLPDQKEDIQAFKAENKRVKRPRMLLFWNRDFSDEVVTYYVDYKAKAARIDAGAFSASSGKDAGVKGYTWDGARVGATASNRASVAGVSASGQRVDVEGTARMNPQEARKNLEGILNWKVESGFKKTFIQGGARLINRDMIMRTQGADAKANDEVNTHSLETKAMMGKADMMVEILLAPSAESESGLAFQVNVTAIETGETIASVYTDAMPPVQEITSYEATSRGFEQSTTREGFSNEAVGRQLAIDTMKELTDYWKMMAE